MMRTYGDACGIARALDVVGDRWALLVIRDLLLGPKRFTDLRAGLPRVSPDVLSQRLRELEDAGLLQRRRAVARRRHHVRTRRGDAGAQDDVQPCRGDRAAGELRPAPRRSAIP